MRACSIIGCDGKRKTSNQTSLTFHGLPRNESKRKKWLEAIGIENIRRQVKKVYICSQHFDEKCFNKTLDVIRLRDDALPLIRPLKCQHPDQRKSGVVKENQSEKKPVIAGRDTSKLLPVKTGTPLNPAIPAVSISSGVQNPSQHKTGIVKGNRSETIPVIARHDTSKSVSVKIVNTRANITHAAVAGTSKIATFVYPVKTGTPLNPVNPVPVTVSRTSGFVTSADQTFKIKKVEDKCVLLRKKVKALNETVRRQRNKIAEFKNLIKNLQANNLKENSVLEAGADSKDFIKRTILKTEGLSRQYPEEAREFAQTLYYFSPKAYRFLRRKYNECLPHPRTLSRWHEPENAQPGVCEEAIEESKNSIDTEGRIV